MEEWVAGATKILRSGFSEKPELSESVALYPKQQEVLSLLMQKKDALYICRTGGGKSAVYFIAAKLLRNHNPKFGPAVVISPLLSLMNDQIESAKRFQLEAATINSKTSKTEKARIRKLLEKNKLDLLFVTPEKLTKGKLATFIPQLAKGYEPEDDDSWTQPSILVIDEVHCMSDWGHDFRVSYFIGLRDYLQQFSWAKSALKLLTSATVPARALKDLQSVFGGPEKLSVVRDNLYRQNLSIRAIGDATLSRAERIAWLKKLLQKPENVLIFDQRIEDVDALAKELQDAGINARAYHSQIKPKSSLKEIETDFKIGKIKVLVSTTSLGMGFDKPDIKFVVHMYTPSSPAQYYQEIGRAGRAIDSASAFVLHTKPWRTDVREALSRTFQELEAKNPISVDELKQELRKSNIPDDATESAVSLGAKKGFFRTAKLSVSFVRAQLPEEKKASDEFAEEREEEVEFMKTLFETPSASNQFCIWQRLLDFLGCTSASCEVNCSQCKPKDGDIRAKKLDESFLLTTNQQQIPVLAFSYRNRIEDFDATRLVLLLEEYCGHITANPSRWTLTYVPQSNTEYEDPREDNKSDCQAIAQELKLSISDFIEVNPNSKERMTFLRTKEKREECIKDRLLFDLSKVAPDTNVIIYDDVLRSGRTMDKVGEALRKDNPTRKILGIVQTFAVCNELPKPGPINAPIFPAAAAASGPTPPPINSKLDIHHPTDIIMTPAAGAVKRHVEEKALEAKKKNRSEEEIELVSIATPSDGSTNSQQNCLRILFLSSSPYDPKQPAKKLPTINVDGVKSEIESVLSTYLGNRVLRGETGIEIQFFAESSQRWEDLSPVIRRRNPHILHLLCHGQPECLYFTDKEAGQKEVTCENLASLLKLAARDRNLQGVILSACFSDKIALAIVEHLEFAIGMKLAVTDHTSKSFSASLYQHLIGGDDLQHSFNTACVVASLSPIKQVLLATKAGVSPEKIRFG